MTHTAIDIKSLINCGCKCYRGDVTVRRDSRLASCSLESEGDTEDDEETDGTDTHTAISHISRSSFTTPTLND